MGAQLALFRFEVDALNHLSGLGVTHLSGTMALRVHVHGIVFLLVLRRGRTSSLSRRSRISGTKLNGRSPGSARVAVAV